MPSNIERTFNAALALPAESRAALAEELLASLDNSDRKEIDSAWAKEAEERIEAYERGELKAIPLEDVFPSLVSENQSCMPSSSRRPKRSSTKRLTTTMNRRKDSAKNSKNR